MCAVTSNKKWYRQSVRAGCANWLHVFHRKFIEFMSNARKFNALEMFCTQFVPIQLLSCGSFSFLVTCPLIVFSCIDYTLRECNTIGPLFRTCCAQFTIDDDDDTNYQPDANNSDFTPKTERQTMTNEHDNLQINRHANSWLFIAFCDADDYYEHTIHPWAVIWFQFVSISIFRLE